MSETKSLTNLSLKQAQKLILDIYGVPDDRLYEIEDLLYYGLKFTLEYIKQLQIKNEKLAEGNLVISFAWFLALMNRYHFNLETITWKRYSYKCPFCLEIPCVCVKKVDLKSQKTGRPASRKPISLEDWQQMINKIYLNEDVFELNFLILRKIDDLHYSFRKFLREKEKKYFKEIEINGADYFILILRIFNSLKGSLEKVFLRLFNNGCHLCHKTPCECNYF